jgi:16S rRNA (uracil1498-N3)-methyltransferase
MRRFLIDPSCVSDGEITIRDEREIHHMRTALRLRPGAEAMLSDGSGNEYFSKLIGYTQDDGIPAAHFEVLYVKASETEPETKVTLFQCLPKRGKMEYIIQKTTELGVHGIVPVTSKRSVSRSADTASKTARWQRIAEEACKQSGRGRVPRVFESIGVSDIPLVVPKGALIIFPYEQEHTVSIKSVLRAHKASGGEREIALIIGPEGGFTDHEADMLQGAGARVCSLGKTILRTETAGPASIAMIRYELELDE